ncbi:anti-sigma-F factor Fin family protein [Cerasibacillus terrae]|uniref:Anti-sigma-F factor Fin family protein n=1 Tax=Cerasibacillus terrae TaxID=2498845 RepID=A0A5C8NQM8_9BACI|nr:anti-sigma-F factor Fin family protein [Cerasibacillus terrae]TXL63446.1 anti-sigma-F factor Fin family protein [Cerasibacillus terrae]
MAIIYNCRHCGYEIGKLQQQFIDTAQLGWDQLSIEDRQKMIQYEANGDISIQSICENCQEALGNHPEYHELDFFIQ